MKKLYTLALISLGFALLCSACGKTDALDGNASAVGKETVSAIEIDVEDDTLASDPVEEDSSIWSKDDAAVLVMNWEYDPASVVSFKGDYKAIPASSDILEVSEEDVQAEINFLQASNLDYREVSDRGAMDGDLLNIDFTGTMDGEEIYKEEGFDLQLGSGILSELETNLEGNHAGDNVTLDIDYGDDYYDSALCGKTVHFEVKVNKVSVPYSPDYNDDFIKAHTEYSSVAEYEASLVDTILMRRKSDIVSNWIEENCKLMEYPQALYDEYEEKYIDWYKTAAQYYGMSFEELLHNMNFETEERFRNDEDTKASVDTNIRMDYAYRYIQAAEEMTFTAGDLKAYAERFAVENGYKDANELMMVFTEEEILQYFVKQSVLDFLYDHISVE